jgi:hypothetical protein
MYRHFIKIDLVKCKIWTGLSHSISLARREHSFLSTDIDYQKSVPCWWKVSFDMKMDDYKFISATFKYIYICIHISVFTLVMEVTGLQSWPPSVYTSTHTHMHTDMHTHSISAWCACGRNFQFQNLILVMNLLHSVTRICPNLYLLQNWLHFVTELHYFNSVPSKQLLYICVPSQQKSTFWGQKQLCAKY